MRRLTALALLLSAAFAVAQTKAPAKRAPKSATSSAAQPATTGQAGLPTEATVESFLRHTFGWDTSIQWKVLNIKPSEVPQVAEVLVGLKNAQGQAQTISLFVLPGGKWAVAGEMLPFGADPYAPLRQELATRAHGPAKGPAGSRMTIVEFSDLQCPACKAAQPTIDQLLQDEPNARFIFQNFPLQDLHPWAFKAATYADCLGRENPDAFWKFISADYANQEQVTVENVDQKMKEFVTQAGGDANKVAACAALPSTAARVKESIKLGNDVGVTGTPTLYVNGRKIQSVSGMPYEMLKAIVERTPPE